MREKNRPNKKQDGEMMFNGRASEEGGRGGGLAVFVSCQLPSGFCWMEVFQG